MEAIDREVEDWADGGVSVAEASRFLGAVGKSALYEHMSAGRVVWAKLGRRRVISKRSLMRLLNEAGRGGNAA